MPASLASIIEPPHDRNFFSPPGGTSGGSSKRPRIEPAADVNESRRIAAAAAADSEKGAGPHYVIETALSGSQSAAQLLRDMDDSVGPTAPEQRIPASSPSESPADSQAHDYGSGEAAPGMASGSRLQAGVPESGAAGARVWGMAGSKPYLCTGFDCYVVREPCVMCAMALVHSRVRRVIYAESNPEHGALGGSLKLHGQQSLNHHYSVYRMARELA